ncbi:uncharacterized protein LOC125884104 [Epinephelus fuscoguttatus]|uniref:uncharacterized protein LOC125884104 n=1 Tax=Epinephelus fuscoguttatus TaxID=293821 RepID=UPI0020D11A8A|nr:uncharacterized protein LOC125884104 [Epinephelus fuscoguttatus]
MAAATGLYGLMLKTMFGGSRQICERALWIRKKRRKKINVLMMALCGAMAATSVQRSMWMRCRSQEWWDRDVTGFTDQDFFQNFRMSRNTFHYICQRLSSRLSRRDMSFRRSISLRMWLWLATGTGYRTLANLFGIAKSSVCSIVHDFCKAVHHVLMPDYIKLPQGDDLQEMLQGFRQSFTNIYTGWPGSVHDARVLKNSRIYTMAERGELFPADTEEINGVQVPIMLLGDPAYPLRTWLLKGYTDSGALTDQQRYFNEQHSRARMTVECAFGRLKGDGGASVSAWMWTFPLSPPS